MATIVFSAIGTAIGGPIGGTLGALIGNQVDQMVFKPGGREGPRLKELQVSTSSYGTPIARHFGRVRTAGSVIWATDLVESTEQGGGGKGKPSVTTYSYSVSLAVALASRPIEGLGRIWADGNLLRGARGDLKTGGELRIYCGHGDQAPDPLIAADRGAQAPAFRGLAYCVFESLQLADFGNRIPSLTFEVIADSGEVQLMPILAPVAANADVVRPLQALQGFTDGGGSIASDLSSIGQIYPLSFDTAGNVLSVRAADEIPANPPLLPQPTADKGAQSFGAIAGKATRRQPDQREIPEGLRYYDTARDFQPGLQRCDGRARQGRSRIIEFPGAMAADHARRLANEAAERASWAQEILSWRIAELDPSLTPGKIVRVPEKAGHWRIESWEWREGGIELTLSRLPFGPARSTPADAGTILPSPDRPATPTVLRAFELPWDGMGSSELRKVYAAATSSSAGWTGANLYAMQGSSLIPLGSVARQRSVIGHSLTALTGSEATLLDRNSVLQIVLDSADFALSATTVAGLASGANRALLGEEIIQFADAVRIDTATWELRGILRGRGGTEARALAGHPPGTSFVLLDAKQVEVDISKLGSASSLAAMGLADSAPVLSPITTPGATLKPLTPVHPRAQVQQDGSLSLSWTRRARGAWEWRDLVETPLNEQSERYLVGIGNSASPALFWDVATPQLNLSAQMLADISAAHPGQPVWVRQVGSWSSSDPLLLFTLA